MSAKKKQEFQTTREIERNEKVKFWNVGENQPNFQWKIEGFGLQQIWGQNCYQIQQFLCLVISSTFKVLPFHSKMSEVMTPKQIAKSLKVFANLIELLT